MLEILKPGPLALIEDAGRPGLAAVGVSASGAFDRGAFAEGGWLVGNDGSQAAIEVTLGGLVVRSTGRHRVALTGAQCPAAVNGTPVRWGEAFDLAPADVLSLGVPGQGLRSYLSVAGGVDVPPVLGSRSTDVLSGLGPARLAAGDFLPVGPALAPGRPRSPLTPTAAVEWTSGDLGEPNPLTGQGASLRPPATGSLDLLPGPRTDWLADPSALAGEWRVSPDSNRVGVRLTGPVLARADGFAGVELPSEPLVRGAVQLPPSGQPLIFGPDHPTTGGYPVIAVLTEASNDRLAQCRPGEVVRLVWPAPSAGVSSVAHRSSR